MQKNLLNCLTYSYLILPFLIFVLGWLKLPISLGIVLIFGWIGWRNRGKIFDHLRWPGRPDRYFLIGILILGVWVLLSGIGGYGFQNMDFSLRNAIFRDLIQFKWPVVYPAQPDNPIHVMVYYIGFWLPAALIGKLAGWHAGNAFLFLWTWAGVLLVVAQIRRQLSSSFLMATALLIFFSGMDALGVLYMRYILPGSYPSLWPPLQHIEGWVPSLQYSSFTTQLFWVFNQAVPAWVCISLVMNSTSRRYLFMIWSLCFFYAPLPALGMIPLLVYEVFWNPQKDPQPGNEDKNNRFFRIVISLFNDLIKAFSVENILGGGIVAWITYLYFSVNLNTTRYSIQIPSPFLLIFYSLFILLEGGILWLLLLPEYRKTVLFYIVGFLLLLFPFLNVGQGRDLTSRGSIPVLFYLMIFSGKSILRGRSNLYIPVVICLLIGALTPIFELNRSVFRSAVYYLDYTTHIPQLNQTTSETPIGFLPFEWIHPKSLIYDDVITLSNFKISDAQNFLAPPGDSLFFRYLANADDPPIPLDIP